MKDDSYLVMRRSERQFVIEASMGNVELAREYCQRRDWHAPDGADLVIYHLVEVMVEK